MLEEGNLTAPNWKALGVPMTQGEQMGVTLWGEGGRDAGDPGGGLGPQWMCLWRKGSWKQAMKGEAQKIYARSVAPRT